MGRWSNTQTLTRHYFRLYGEAYLHAANALSRMRTAELGHDTSEDASVTGRLHFLDHRAQELTDERDDLFEENRELRERLGMATRARSEESAIVPVPVLTRRVSKWANVSDDELRRLIAAASSQKAVLESVGVSFASKNYKRLRREALRLGLSLPEKFQSLRKKAS